LGFGSLGRVQADAVAGYGVFISGSSFWGKIQRERRSKTKHMTNAKQITNAKKTFIGYF